MADHDRFDEAVAAYAIGALDGAERQAFEAHLATCGVCRAALAEFDAVVAAVGMDQTALEPPASLKARVLARATAQPQPAPLLARPAASRAAGIGSWRGLAAAAAVVAVAGLGTYAWSLHGQLVVLRTVAADAAGRSETLRVELMMLRRESARLTQTVSLLSAPDLVRVDLKGHATAEHAIGHAYLSRARGLFLSADGLPALTAGRVYQLWVIPGGAGAAPVSAGVFTVDSQGASNLDVPLPPTATPIKTVAVTAEPGPTGSAGPTSAILLAGSAGD